MAVETDFNTTRDMIPPNPCDVLKIADTRPAPVR